MGRRLWFVACMLSLIVGLTLFGNVPGFSAGKDKDKNKIEKGQPTGSLDCKNLEVKAGKEKGIQERFFAYPMDKVKAALIDGMKAIEFEVKKDDGKTIEASHKRHMGMFAGSGGENLVAQLVEAKEGEVAGTKVTAETKKGFVGRAGQKSWSNAVLDQAECILKAGK
ncbi:MAG: hypothetical protein ACHQKY_11695 [Terriglobia bacterium]